MIRKEGNQWVVRTSDGSKVLGRHLTKEEALKQLRAIEVSKQSGKKR